MIAQEDIDALEELKATQESLASSIEMELKKLQSRYKDLQIDYDQQKSQLIEALLSKDKLQQSMTENRSKDESKADESVETKQMKANLDKTSSELKASQEVSRTNTSRASEELSREQALLGYGLAVKISLPPEEVPLPESPIRSTLRPEEVPLPQSPTLLSDVGHGLLNIGPVLHLESISSSEVGAVLASRHPSADIQHPKSASSWKFWRRQSRSPAVNSVSFELESLPPHFSGSSLSISRKELLGYTRKLTNDIAATPKPG
jgi:hypothetical protein